MNLKRLRWAIIAYVIFDLYIGGNCGGLLPLNIASAAAQSVALLSQGQLGISCNAVTTATSVVPGAAGGCTSLNLLTSGGNLPGVYTWQVITTGSPSSLTVTFQGSLDGVTWTQLGTTSSAATNTTNTAAGYRFLGCIPSTLSGGTSPTVTCQISVTSSPAVVGSGTVSANSGSAGAMGTYAAASGSTTIGPDTLLTDASNSLAYTGTSGISTPIFKTTAGGGGSCASPVNGVTFTNANSAGVVSLGANELNICASGVRTADFLNGMALYAGSFSFATGKGQHFNNQAATSDAAGVCSGTTTTCSVTFTTAYTSTPSCVVTPTTAGVTSAIITTQSGSGFTVTYAPSASTNFNYLCMGNPN